MNGRLPARADVLEARWRCRTGVSVRPVEGAVEVVVDGRGPFRVPAPPSLAATFAQLAQGIAENDLAAAAGGASAYVSILAQGFGVLARLRSLGLLVAEVGAGDRHLVTVCPLAPGFEFWLPAATETDPPPGLSRFSYLRREGGRWVLENPDVPCRLVLHDPDAPAWLDRAETSPGRELRRLLARMGFLAAEDECAPGRTWEFHDRVFHHKSRPSGHTPHGGTWRFRPEVSSGPTPAQPGPVRVSYEGETVELPVPDLAASRPLAEVMERRRSRRRMGAEPVTLANVGALFYRVARNTEGIGARGIDPGAIDPGAIDPGAIDPGTIQDKFVQRTYPSGGSLHELEFYLAVRACRGLEPGFHHYRADAHALTRLGGAGSAAQAMIRKCAMSWAQPDAPPQCLVVIASRMPRVAWKYEAIAYRLSLLGAGAALHALGLAAEDLYLHGCISGTGDPALFARATGVSSWEETSIAEFGFGSA